jgi:hypothetical protein
MNWATTFRRAFVALICAIASVAARADAHLTFIDMGTPKNGATVMNGWRGVVVRVALDGGLPITRIGVARFFPQDGDIYGNIAQRWTDPTGQGKYTQTSPGPLPANNTFDSDFNFDTHLLGPADKFVVQSTVETSRQGFLTSRTGVPSDGFTGYGAAPFAHYELDPIRFSLGSHTGGLLDVSPAFQSNTIDVAYVVTDSAFTISLDAFSGGERFPAFGSFVVPEPGTLSGATSIAAAGALQRRRRRSASASPSTPTSAPPSYPPANPIAA